MLNQHCAVCEKSDFRILYKQNFSLSQINEKIFSARRLPDRLHYRIVKCNRCGLVYSDPILPSEKIEKLYKKSFTDYDEQIENLKETYGFYLRELKKYQICSKMPVLSDSSTLLDIGCGNGFMLEEALKQGYKHVYGVEPGKKSVAKAKPSIRKNIVIDVLRPKIFKDNFFDVICCFQTLDHIPDPNKFLSICYQILKKGGLILFLNHDAGAPTNKILGEASPIIDVEHTYLFDKKTIRKIFEKHRFKVLGVKSAFNIHYLSYWIHLIPLPNFLKLNINKFLGMIKLDKLRMNFYPGNFVIFAEKP